MSDWPRNEMDAAVEGVRQPHLERLKALGCLTGVARIGAIHQPFGVGHIRPCSDKLYEPDEAGMAAMIVPVCWPEHFEAFGEIVTLWPMLDLIAFQTNRPATWYWRTGNGWALGGHRLEDWRGEPVPVVATPLDWLRTGGEAVCVLDWADASPVWPLLRMVGELVVHDDLLARKLLGAIDRTSPRPRITVEGRRRAA